MKNPGSLILTIVGVALLLGLGYFLYTYMKPVPSAEANVPPAGSITIRGELTCLPHHDTSGPQTMECAFGLQDTEGRYYGLRDEDGVVGSTPFGIEVEIRGVFEPGRSDRYQGVGTIDVASVTAVSSAQAFALYFQDRMIERGIENQNGAMPIEGFDAGLLMGAFGGLVARDFEGVEAFEGIYSVEGGEVVFTRTQAQPISSAERTLSVKGFGTLLSNLSERLGEGELSTEAQVDSIIDRIDQTP